MTNHAARNLFICTLLTLTILTVNATIAAQCVAKDSDIRVARYQQGSTLVDVALTKRITPNDLATTGTGNHWRLDDLISLTNIPINGSRAGTQQDDTTFTTILLDLNSPLAVDHVYRLTNPSLTFLGCQTADDEKPQALLRIRKIPAPGPVPTPAPNKNFYVWDKSKAKSDSDVYISGTLEGAEGGKPTFAADIKLERPIGINKSHVMDFRPYFNLKASSTKNGNADSMNFGGKFNINFDVADTGGLRYVLWTPAGGFESDRRFRNVNLVTSQILTFGIPGNKNTFKWRARLLPFIGFELGRNLKSPVSQAANRTVARGLAGATFYLNFDRNEDSSLSFEVDYIRRFLLKREISFTEDDDNNLIPLFVGKGPRDYIKVTTEYDFSKFTGFTLGYEYGRLPPNFELVNHKYSVGLVFKFKFKKKP